MSANFIRVLLAVCAAMPAMASTITVTSLADDGSPGTLRYAIGNANSGDTVTFNVTGTITLAQNLGILQISQNLTINGPGATNLIVSGANTFQVFGINPGANVTITGLTIQTGIGTGNYGGGNGGGISNFGAATVSDVIFYVNSTGGAGGGIYNRGTLTLSNALLVGNTGIESSGAAGGGIANDGTATVSKTTFSLLSANPGGGIYNSASGNITIINSTFSQNANQAIFNNGNASLVFSTISGNNGGVPTLSLSQGIYNLNASTTLKNTILANNPAGNCFTNGGSFISLGYNLSDDNTCIGALTQAGDQNSVSAGLDPAGLKNNGGATPTIAILSSSPAFNIIPLSPTNYCTALDGRTPIGTDQRGVLRPQVSACDIGAVELDTDDDSGLAQLSGANTFSGNQTVNGTVNANAFVGDGSGLTGIVAATANNTNLLGGLPPSAFAPASGSPNYVAKGGDTMTGTLNLPANGLIAGGNQLALFGGNVGIGTANPEGVANYTSLHIDNPTASFGGSFMQLSNSGTATKGRIVFDPNGLLLCGGCGGGTPATPVRIKAGDVTSATDSHIFILPNGNVGIGTVTPGAKLDVNGPANFSGLVTFASGQTFPGAGNSTITGVTAGTGLSGGGTAGTVTLNNTGVLSVGAGTGILSTGGQSPTVSLNTAFADGRYAQLGAGNTFAGTQSMQNLNVSGQVTAGALLANAGGFSANNTTAALTVIQSGSGNGLAVTGGAYAVLGNALGSGTGIYGSTGTGTAGVFGVTGTGKILSGQNNSREVFSVSGSGALTIGGGTQILEHLSMTFNPAFPALKQSTCSSTTFPYAGVSDGDTLALGVPNARMTGGGTLLYSAWVSAPNTVTIRACNIDPNSKQTTAGSGAIRVDLWKH